MIKFSPEGRICSFCGIVGGPHTKFAGGLGSMICGDCVGKYYKIMASPERSREVQRPPWEEMDVTELLGILHGIAANADQVNEFLAGWVRIVRARKGSWSSIGVALNMSRQAVWERYSKLPKPRTEVDDAAS